MRQSEFETESRQPGMTDQATENPTTFPTKLDTTKLIRTFKLQAGKMKTMLDKLDTKESGLPFGTFAYRKTAVLYIPNTTDAEQNAYLVATRYVNETEISFLFGGFFHAQTSIMLRLTTLFNAWEDVTGTVSSCRHIDGSIHEVVLRFDQPIDASLLTAEADTIRVLVVEDDPLFEQVARNHLKALNAEVDHAPNGQVGVEMALNNVYDAVMMDMEMPVMNGLTAIKTLREQGYAGTIIAVTGMTRPEVREQCTAAGCDGFVAKPYTKDGLASAIRNLRGEPIYSDFEGDPAMHDIIQMFVDDLPKRVRSLTEAIRQCDSKESEIQIRALKASTGACGFLGLSEAADAIENALIDGADVETVEGEFKRFIRQCMRVRTRPTQSTEAESQETETVEEECTEESESSECQDACDETNLKIRCA